MNLDFLSILSAVVSLVTLAVAFASLPDHGWERLAKWWSHLSVWAVRLWYAFALITSVFGIAAFGLASGHPSRGDILMLVVHCFNLVFYIVLIVFALARKSEAGDVTRANPDGVPP